MLSAHATKSFLPGTLQRHACSPSAYPALSYAVRDFAVPAVVLRRHESTAPVVKSTAAASAPAAAHRRPHFFDIDDFFSGAPFGVSAFDLAPFMRRLDLEDDLRRGRYFSPGYDVSSHDDRMKISIDLPGVKLEDVTIEVEADKLLKISGSRKIEKDGQTSSLNFDRRFTLGKLIDHDNITANLSDGVLTITAPKLGTTEKVKKIEITQHSDEDHPDVNHVEEIKRAA